MPRPQNCRRISSLPDCRVFKPAGVPVRNLAEIELTVDELEAIRLADLEGLYQEQAAEKMSISRPTFSRIVEQARKKIASALINGWALRIDGGSVTTRSRRVFQCQQCGHIWQAEHGSGRPEECPSCHHQSIHRVGIKHHRGRCLQGTTTDIQENNKESEMVASRRVSAGGGRGGGAGRSRRRRNRCEDASGSGASCVCVQCGTRLPHKRGVPCAEQACPKCGAPMARE